MRLTGARVARDARTAEALDLEVRDGRVSFAAASSNSPVLDLTGFLVLPGLINAHDHLEFNLFPSLGRRIYRNAKSWATDIYQPAASPVKEHLALSKHTRMVWGGLKNLLSGVTTVAHHNPLEDTLLYPSFPVNVVKHFGWAHSLDFSPDIVERFRATPEAWPFILHAGEGVDEHAHSEVSRLEQLGVLSDRTVLVHAIGLDQPDLQLLHERRSSLVWCPSSNFSTYGQTLCASAFQSDFNVILGTDSALTAQVDLIDEIEAAQRTYPLTTDDLFDMVTTRSARVLRLNDGEGMIREGGVADLLIVEDRGQSPAESLRGMRPELVLVRGRIRLASPRFAKNGDQNAINVEGRGNWFTDVNVPSLHEETVRALGAEYRLAGKRVSQ